MTREEIALLRIRAEGARGLAHAIAVSREPKSSVDEAIADCLVELGELVAKLLAHAEESS